MIQLILASSSKQRKDIFDSLGIKYEIIVSNVAEMSDLKKPDAYVMELSKLKADSVANQIDKKAIIISADSIIYGWQNI